MNELKTLLTLVGFVLLISCGEIIEEDISGKEVFLLAPGDSTVVSSDTVSFWWEYVDGARDYQFRLVSPSFDKPQRVFADSITPGNLIDFILPSGEYQWEVRALNAGYSTDFFYRSFRVDSTVRNKDISDQIVELLAPGNGFVSSELDISFWWEELEDADNYELLIVTPNFTSIQLVVLDTVITQDLITIELDSGGYEWGVRALADGTKTKLSKRSLTIDPE